MSGFPFRGTTALITGTGSGIGRALAAALAARGCRLALADMNGDRLEETRAGLGPAEATLHAGDIAAPGAAAGLVEAAAGAHGGLALMVNNAGIALGGRFEDVSPEDFDRLTAVNFAAPVRLTRAALPYLRRAPEGRIVNLSSLFGLLAPPGQAAYAASKFALRGFSMALAHELRGSSVGVTLVHPGGVRIRIAADAALPRGADPAHTARQIAKLERSLRMPPERAAERIVAAIAARRDRVIVGRDAQVLSVVERIAPVGYWRLIERWLR